MRKQYTQPEVTVTPITMTGFLCVSGGGHSMPVNTGIDSDDQW